MTDSDGYFSPRNHPQRMVFLPDPETPKQDVGENTPLISTPSPPYSSLHTGYGASSANMGNPNSGNPYPPGMGNTHTSPPYGPPYIACGSQGPPSAWWGYDPWAEPSASKAHPVRHLAKWLLVRLSFVVLAYLLLRRVLYINVNGHGGSGGPPPGRGKGPRFSHCPPRSGNSEERKRFVFDANPASFSFEQVSFRAHGAYPQGHIQLVGDVLVKGVEDAKDLTVDFDFRLSDEALRDRFSFDVKEGGIVFRTDITPFENINSCIEVVATISVPLSKPSFADFSISSETLNIVLTPSVDLAVENLALTANSGNIEAERSFGIDSNRTVIIIDSGNIHGDFALVDLVQLETKSGDITASIIPQDSPTVQAEFKASTISGNIKIMSPHNPKTLPANRVYSSVVSTISGSVSGIYLLGSHLGLSANSGSVKATVIPTGSRYATFVTDTKQGNTDIEFYGFLGDGAKGLDATHGSVSGNIRVEISADWEGVVTGKSLSGGVSVEGRDVNVVEDERTWPVGRWVKGVKGVGEDAGRVEGEVVSGNVWFRVGGDEHGHYGGHR